MSGITADPWPTGATTGKIPIWRDQVALVTGGSRGIGRAIALCLARHGAAVCVNYTARGDAAERVAQEIRDSGGRAVAIGADVADAAAVQRMAVQVAAELGPVTIVVNNAGLALTASIETFDTAALDRMRRVNVDGIIHTTRAVLPAMRERHYGRIVNIASNAAHGTALAGTTFYAATKAEVVILTRRFALELGQHGITVNAVAPGYVPTDMTRGDRSAQEFDEIAASIAARAMVGRCGKPEDIANAVAFLAAPEAGFVTAQVLTVDGGRMDYIGHP